MRSHSLMTLAAAGLAGTLTTIAAVQPAYAAEHRAFTMEAFQAAQRAGRPILIDVFADWCSVCARQAPILRQIAADPANKDLVIFKMDFDKQKAEQRALGVRMQSTLVAFRGTRETGRLAGETNPARIAALVASTRG